MTERSKNQYLSLCQAWKRFILGVRPVKQELYAPLLLINIARIFEADSHTRIADEKTQEPMQIRVRAPSRDEQAKYTDISNFCVGFFNVQYS